MRPRWTVILAHEIDAKGRLDAVNPGFEPEPLPAVEARWKQLAARR